MALLLFFPNCGTAYYEKATGRKRSPVAADPAQARSLKAFAAKHDVAFLDLLQVFQRKVDALTDADPITAYPYLKIDGHPSLKGHDIIAGEIARFLSAQGDLQGPQLRKPMR